MEKNLVCVEKNPVKMEKNIAWIQAPSFARPLAHPPPRPRDRLLKRSISSNNDANTWLCFTQETPFRVDWSWLFWNTFAEPARVVWSGWRQLPPATDRDWRLRSNKQHMFAPVFCILKDAAGLDFDPSTGRALIASVYAGGISWRILDGIHCGI